MLSLVSLTYDILDIRLHILNFLALRKCMMFSSLTGGDDSVKGEGGGGGESSI